MRKQQYVTIPWMKSPFILHIRPVPVVASLKRWTIEETSSQYELLLEVVLGEYASRVENDVLDPLHNTQFYIYLDQLIAQFSNAHVRTGQAVYSFCWFPHTILHGYPISHNALVTLASQAVDEIVEQVPKSGIYRKDYKEAQRWTRPAYRNPFFFLYRADQYKKKWRISAEQPIYTYNHDMALNPLAVTTLGHFGPINKWGLRRPFHIDHTTSFRGTSFQIYDLPKAVQTDLWYDGKRCYRWTYDDALEGNRITTEQISTTPEWGKYLAFGKYISALQSVDPNYELDTYLACPLRYGNG